MFSAWKITFLRCSLPVFLSFFFSLPVSLLSFFLLFSIFVLFKLWMRYPAAPLSRTKSPTALLLRFCNCGCATSPGCSTLPQQFSHSTFLRFCNCGCATSPGCSTLPQQTFHFRLVDGYFVQFQSAQGYFQLLNSFLSKVTTLKIEGILVHFESERDSHPQVWSEKLAMGEWSSRG